jgi:hypothetical protein
MGGLRGGKYSCFEAGTRVPFIVHWPAKIKGGKEKKALVSQIDFLDVMSAIRPYQDALINAKIDNVAMVGDFNLARRTCRMIQGELVLPSTPTVTGYASYSPCNPIPAQAGA